MEAQLIAFYAALVILGIDAVLVAALISLKAIHRRRSRRHAERRAAYLDVLTHHLNYRNSTHPIGRDAADDPAFLDALIDVRDALAGPEVDTLAGIIERYDIAEHQEARLRTRFPLGRRLRAAVVLAEIGDEGSADALMEHLSDREPEIRIQAARGLRQMGWTPAIDAIVDRFSIESPWVRSRFSDILSGYGPKATWPLVAYVRVNHRFEIDGPVAAIRTLGRIGDREAGPPLLDLLTEADQPEIEVALISALGRIGGPEALLPLAGTAQDEDWRLRAETATALGTIGAPDAIPVLAELLEDRNWWVRRNSAAALARIPGGVAALYQALGSDDRFARDAAAESLTDAGELIAARRHADDGNADERELALLAHMSAGGAA